MSKLFFNTAHKKYRWLSHLEIILLSLAFPQHLQHTKQMYQLSLKWKRFLWLRQLFICGHNTTKEANCGDSLSCVCSLSNVTFVTYSHSNFKIVFPRRCFAKTLILLLYEGRLLSTVPVSVMAIVSDVTRWPGLGDGLLYSVIFAGHFSAFYEFFACIRHSSAPHK